MTKQSLFDLDRLIAAYGDACFDVGRFREKCAESELERRKIARYELRQFVILLDDGWQSVEKPKA